MPFGEAGRHMPFISTQSAAVDISQLPLKFRAVFYLGILTTVWTCILQSCFMRKQQKSPEKQLKHIPATLYVKTKMHRRPDMPGLLLIPTIVQDMLAFLTLPELQNKTATCTKKLSKTLHKRSSLQHVVAHKLWGISILVGDLFICDHVWSSGKRSCSFLIDCKRLTGKCLSICALKCFLHLLLESSSG